MEAVWGGYPRIKIPPLLQVQMTATIGAQVINIGQGRAGLQLRKEDDKSKGERVEQSLARKCGDIVLQISSQVEGAGVVQPGCQEAGGSVKIGLTLSRTLHLLDTKQWEDGVNSAGSMSPNLRSLGVIQFCTLLSYSHSSKKSQSSFHLFSCRNAVATENCYSTIF